MNKRAHLINNHRFSVRFCQALKGLGIIRVGVAEDFVARCMPTTKIGVGTGFVRVNALKRELQTYLGRDIESTYPYDYYNKV